MRIALSGWTCLSMLASAVIADVSFFTYPPRSDDASSVDFSNNPVYSIDDSITVQWSSSFVTITLLVEQYNNNFRPVLVDRAPNPGSANWTVSYNDFISFGSINSNTAMRFSLYDAPTQNHIYSHFFNMSSPPDAAAVSSANAPQTTASVVFINAVSTSAPPASTTLAKSTSATPTPQSAPASATTSPHSTFGAAGASSSSTSTSSSLAPIPTSHGLDANTQAGLGVGLGLGLPLLAILTAALIILFRRHNRAYRPRGQPWPPSQPPPYSQSPPSHPGFANQPQMHAVPILSAPPPARSISHGHHPSNENGYAPPSALLKPWPGAGPLAGDQDGEYETRTYDAWGRPIPTAVKGAGQVKMSEVAGDEGRWGPSEMEAGRRGSFGTAKELPALPGTPRGRPETLLMGRYEQVIKGD